MVNSRMSRQDAKDIFPWYEWLPHTCELSLESPSQYFAVKSVLHLDDNDKPHLLVTCRFHRTIPIYTAGETVSGTVYVIVENPFPCKSVNIHLKGVCFMDVPKSNPTGSKSIDLLHMDIFNSWTADSPEEGKIDSGLSKFKFSLQIPEKARATTLENCLSVIYCILVEFEAPDNLEYKKIMAFGGYVKIRSRPYIDERILNGKISCSEVLDVFGEDGVLKGQLSVEAQLSGHGAVLTTGQKVNYDVKITQQYFNGSYKLKEIFSVLIQNVVYQSEPVVEYSRFVTPSKQCRNVTMRKKQRAHTYKFTLPLGDIIPSTHPSVDQDGLVSVSYHLQLMIKHEFEVNYCSLCRIPVAIVHESKICTDKDGNESYPPDDDVSSEEEDEALVNAFDACYLAAKHGPENETLRYYDSLCQLLTKSSEFLIDLLSGYSFMILPDKNKPAWRKSPRAQEEAEKEAEEFKRAVEKARKVNDFVEMGVKSTLAVMAKWKGRKFATRQNCKEFRLFLKQNVQKFVVFKKWVLSEMSTYSSLVSDLSECAPAMTCLKSSLAAETSKELSLIAPRKGERASVGQRKSRLISKISNKEIGQLSLNSSSCCQTLNKLVKHIWFDERETPMSSNNQSRSSSVPFAVITIFPSCIKSDLSHDVLFKYPNGLKKYSSISNIIIANKNGSVTEDISGSPTETATEIAGSTIGENTSALSGLMDFTVIENKIISKLYIYYPQCGWNATESKSVTNVTRDQELSDIPDELKDADVRLGDKRVRQKKSQKKPFEKTVTDRNVIQKTQIKESSTFETTFESQKGMLPKTKTITGENVTGNSKKKQISLNCNAIATTVEGVTSRYDCRLREDYCCTTAHVDTSRGHSQHDCNRMLHNFRTAAKETVTINSPEAPESDSSSSDTGSIDEVDTTHYDLFTWSHTIGRDNEICRATSPESEVSDSQKVFCDEDLNVSGEKLTKKQIGATVTDKQVFAMSSMKDPQINILTFASEIMKASEESIVSEGNKISHYEDLNARNKNHSTTKSKQTKSKARSEILIESQNHRSTKINKDQNNQEMTSGQLNEISFSRHAPSQDYDASDEFTAESSFFSSSGSQKCRRIHDSWSILSSTESESVGKFLISFNPSSSINETYENKENLKAETNTAPSSTKLATVLGKKNPVGQRLIKLKTNSKNIDNDCSLLAVEENQPKQLQSVKGDNYSVKGGQSHLIQGDNSVIGGLQQLVKYHSGGQEIGLVNVDSFDNGDLRDKKEKSKIADRFLAMQRQSGKTKQTRTLEHETIETNVVIGDIKSNRILQMKQTIHEAENFTHSRSHTSREIATKVDLSMVHKYSTKLFFEGPTSDGKLCITGHENPKLPVVTRAKSRVPKVGHEHVQKGGRGITQSVIPETERKRYLKTISQKSHRFECNAFEAGLVKESSGAIQTHKNAVTVLKSLQMTHLHGSANLTNTQNTNMIIDRRDVHLGNQSDDSLPVSYCNELSDGKLTPQSGGCSVLEKWCKEGAEMVGPLSSDSPSFSIAVPRTADTEGPFGVKRFEKDVEKLWEGNIIDNMELQHTGIWSHKSINTWTTMKYGDAATVFSVPTFERNRMWRIGPWRSKLNPRAPSFASLLSASQTAQKFTDIISPMPIGDNTHPADSNPIDASCRFYPRS